MGRGGVSTRQYLGAVDMRGDAEEADEGAAHGVRAAETGVGCNLFECLVGLLKFTTRSFNAQDQTTSATPPGGSAASYSYTDAGQTQRVSAGSTAFQYDVTSLRAMTTVNGLYVVPPAPWHSDIRSTSYQ